MIDISRKFIGFLCRFISKLATAKHQNTWQRTLGLKDQLLQITSGLNLIYTDKWSILVIISLHQANRRLNSIYMLLKDDDCDNATILTRSLFELVANISYISKDVRIRLPKYLRHGSMPLTDEEVQQLQQELESANQTTVIEMIPKQSWKSVGELCSDLGDDWLEEYCTFFRYASVPSHSGAFTFGNSFLKLLNRQSSTEREQAIILMTALTFHLRIAKIAAIKFPTQISYNKLSKLNVECNKIGQYLAVSH